MSASERLGVIDAEHLAWQRDWSAATFGPGFRLGVLDHLAKELEEVRAAPLDLGEWVDVVILALDRAWRAGHSPQEIIDAIKAKQAQNEARTWPDWRTTPSDRAIEHDRSAPEPGAPVADARASAGAIEPMRDSYVSHPIKGLDPRVARANAEHVGSQMRGRGFEPVLPMDVEPSHAGPCPPGSSSGQSGHTHTCYMRADLAEQMRCSAIVLCLGWQQSQGCRAEMAAALAAGQDIWVENAAGGVDALPKREATS